jgi:hypothetical protein
MSRVFINLTPFVPLDFEGGVRKDGSGGETKAGKSLLGGLTSWRECVTLVAMIVRRCD